ncbi:hypothetical protein SAMN03080598_01723 [Algoriphagus boritolerans DSM 17298 = JCM 18970]|uniref:Uncharacterized protein n=1 Tax=Algoriphagus boritolerans DSM 17298 = JCM 18970 TaxID=1120964 RepID=A0A1H5VKJ8_9BACT|nr:hypothetical protein SAMN03080598_01723 [Algoriphagus boritolerans DSM 17298 = JCM 18970]
MGGKSDLPFAILTVRSQSRVCNIHPLTGAASKVSDFNFTPKAMVFGLGF